MTFLLRRKRRITRRAAVVKQGATIASAVFVWLLLLSSAQAQTQFITPRFVPAQPISGVVPAVYMEPERNLVPVTLPPQAQMRGQGNAEDSEVEFVRTELPGPQRLFTRDSETQLFDRIAMRMKRTEGSRAIFPPAVVISTEPYRARNFPRMVEMVEPGYVCHGRLLFEQPNFERAGYNFGVLQPALCLGVFYYDVLMLPYHCWSDLHNRYECSAGKCLPGDPSPLLVPRERFSVTGILGQTGAVVGGIFVFP